MNHTSIHDDIRKSYLYLGNSLVLLIAAVFLLILFVLLPQSTYGQSANLNSILKKHSNSKDVARWKKQAQDVTIYRDNWGIAHVYGNTDADAVFGMEYAQAEDDFHRVEYNYQLALGLRAEAKGKQAIYQDLRRKLFIHPKEIKSLYDESPEWLKKLMKAFADGLNYYLYTHPKVKPKVIKHFEPWMALAFSEGSIGGDITSAVDVKQLATFYGSPAASGSKTSTNLHLTYPKESQVLGSNGIAIAPNKTLDHHSLLLINPHVTFYFRDELHMVSKEGLNAYGAVTWGQFFIYQGFNADTGWMHTSSGVRNKVKYLETVTKKNGRYYYRYGKKELSVKTRQITVRYKTPKGMAKKTFTAYYTQHGPVIGKVGEKWETVKLMQRHKRALIQDFKRTKAKDYSQFRETMKLHTNSSNNTIFADSKGNIAYWHSDWIPKRNDKFDWSKPVNGSNPATDIHGLLALSETPHLHNPPNGWLYNSNNWPWSAAGPNSPRQKNFPSYVDRGTEETPRGHHALRLLSGKRGWTMTSLAAAAYDSYLPPFAKIIPKLLNAYKHIGESNPLKDKLAEQIDVLRDWDYRWRINSVATSLAVFWGNQLYRQMHKNPNISRMWATDYVEKHAKPKELLQALAKASKKLKADFGSWQVPWGHINRFQRITTDIKPHFDDSKYSIPVPFTSSLWGSLASFGAHPYPNTKKWYGNNGNSFVCVVKFGSKVRAWAVKVGGISGNPSSPHFTDQAPLYSLGNLRPVYYYKSQLKGHIKREYHPGD